MESEEGIKRGRGDVDGIGGAKERGKGIGREKAKRRKNRERGSRRKRERTGLLYHSDIVGFA